MMRVYIHSNYLYTNKNKNSYLIHDDGIKYTFLKLKLKLNLIIFLFLNLNDLDDELNV
jgi:hypothetical protein